MRSPLGPASDERGVEREQHRGEVGRGVAVRDRAAERAAVAHLVVADLAPRPPRSTPQCCASRSLVSRSRWRVERADRDVVAGVADVGEVAQPADVDEHGRRREAQLHQRDQRHAAGEQLGVVAVLGERGDAASAESART